MKMDEFRLPDLEALVAFGKVGVQLAASRILSILALCGILALAGYVAYSPTWEGASVVAVLALFVFIPALKAESRGRAEVKDGTQ